MKKSFLMIFCLTCLSSAVAQDWAIERLNESPRHHEWVQVKHGERVVHAFLVFPEVKDKATAVVVIHENRGLTDWVRSVADQLAEHGYIAIAPDLLSGMGPDGGKTSDFADRNAARDALYQLPQEQISADLDAVFDYVARLEACNGKVAAAGFCWGGRQTFLYATHRAETKAAFVFYGTPPDSAAQLATIACPIYGFYGGNDARVNASIPRVSESMKTLKKFYEPVTYEGAGHGFMRAGEDPKATAENQKAREAGWQRWLALLGKI